MTYVDAWRSSEQTQKGKLLEASAVRGETGTLIGEVRTVYLPAHVL